jgi:hypothetical protein
MCPHIDVKFVRMPQDLSVEAAIQRWVERISWSNVGIEHASVTIERAGWRRMSVFLTLVLVGGKALAVALARADVYVAVADVFREARKQVLAWDPARRSLAPTG